MLHLFTVLCVIWSAHAQRTSRLGNDPVLFEDDESYYYLDGTFAPLVNAANDTSTLPGYPGVAPTRGFGVDARTTVAFASQARWIVGWTYNYYSLNGKRDVVSYGQDAMTQATTRNEWGPTVGWTTNGWRTTLTYLMNGTERASTRTTNYAYETSNVVVKNRRLDGLQVTLSYTFPIMGRVNIGPSVAYRAIRFHSQARADLYSPSDSYDYRALYRAKTEQALTPMLMIDLRF